MANSVSQRGIKTGRGYFQIAIKASPVIYSIKALHASLAVSSLAQEKGAVIILEGTGKDLRRAGCVPVGKNNQRFCNYKVLFDSHTGGYFGNDDHGRFLPDEKACYFTGGVRIAAAIIAQIQNIALHGLGFHILQGCSELFGRGRLVFVIEKCIKAYVGRSRID